MSSQVPPSSQVTQPVSGSDFGPGYRMCIVLDPDGVIRSVSDVHAVNGWDAAAAIGVPISEAAARGVRGGPRREEWIRRIASIGGSAGPVHYADRRPDQADDGPPQVDTMLTPVRARDGALQSIVVHIEDQTRRLEAAAVARERQGQLTTALGLTGLGSYTFYLRETRMDTDARFDEIYGVDPQQLVEAEGIDGFWRMIHADDRAAVQAALAAAMDGSVDYIANYRLSPDRISGGEVRYIEALGRVESDDDGPLRVIGVIDDVTERRRAEDARLVMQKREAIGTLASGIAHDFNNVISAILSNASVAEAEYRSGASPMTSLAEITRGARRAGGVVKQLLSFGRDAEPRREPFDLALVVEEACALMRTALPTGVDLHLDGADDLPLVVGDSTQMHQVIVNLVTNAGQAIHEQEEPTGNVEVVVDVVDRAGADRRGAPQQPGTYVRLCVADDGPGVPPGVLDQVFDPFFTTKPIGEGTGLGLTATQSIVRAHGGTITVDSRPGEGAKLTILLPVTEQALVAAAAAAAAARRSTAQAMPQVLFVDDETALTRLAERAMTVSGCEAIAFNDPAEALEAFRADPRAFDVLVTDLSMPGMDGLELIDAIHAIRPGLPVVLSSGFITADTAAQAQARGVGRMVPKPCAVHDLARAVLELLAERRSDGAPGEVGASADG